MNNDELPKFKVLSDEEIRNKLTEIQPEGFNWSGITETEMVKFKAIAQAQTDYCQKQLEGNL